MLTVTEISKENHVSCCENSKSSITLLYPIIPCAANLALIMHHAENLGLITWHGKLGETQERTGRPQAAQTWGLRSSASSSPPVIWWPPYPLEGLLLEFFSEGVPLESWNSTTMPSTKIPKPSNFSILMTSNWYKDIPAIFACWQNLWSVKSWCHVAKIMQIMLRLQISW